MKSIHGEVGDKRIDDLLQELPSRKAPLVHQSSPLSEVIRLMSRIPHSRLLYVVDDQGRLLGSISLGAIMRHVLADFREPSVHSRSMIDAHVNETAEHLMRPGPVIARGSDTIDDVLRRLMQTNVKEVPVIDQQERVVANLTAADIFGALLNQNSE